MDLCSAIARLTCGPARILNLPLGTLTPGTAADVCIYDPEDRWFLEPDKMRSCGKNTPFRGWEMPARITHTLLKGRLVYRYNPVESTS
jgi:dihydroorotase